jgi:ubiquinol-cytochrome c reductase cytochrome b subunit
MLSRIWQWLNDRWPFSAAIGAALQEDIAGGSRFAYTLGSAVLTIVLVQVVTGILQIFFFVPTVDHAYNSLGYLRTKVPFGWLIHGLHYWGANAMIVVVVLHMARVFLWGAYKRPRELTWLFGVALLLITMGLSFTGGPLPWDQAGYWAAEVGTSIPGSIPIVGSLTTELMRGGTDMGQLTISRFFTLHVMILPLALFALIVLHIVAFRIKGSAGPWDPVKRAANGPFWPDQAFKDTVTASSVVLVLITLSVFFPPAFTGAADPLSTTFTPKPEWNFLFLYQALKYFEGPLEPLGVAGVPAILLLVIVVVPFLDRSAERNPSKRPVALTGAALLAALLAFLTIAGYVSKPGASETATSAGSKAGGQAPQTATATPESIGRGVAVFQANGCVGCHAISGIGGVIGPDLSGEANRGRTREWLSVQIRNPRTHFPDTIMPSFNKLNNQQLNDLMDYLLSLAQTITQQSPLSKTSGAAEDLGSHAPTLPKGSPSIAEHESTGPAANIIGSPDQGGLIFANQCAGCHGPKGIGKIPNPGSEEGSVPELNPIGQKVFSKDPQDFADAIDRFIQNGSTPSGKAPRLSMPAFGKRSSLTQQQISNIEAYILKLNNVDRAELINPGMSPMKFFFVVVPIFLVVIFVLGGIYRCLPGDKQADKREE